MQNKKSQRNDVLFLWNLWKKNQREEKGLFETSCKNKSTLNTTNVKRSQGAQDRFSDDLECDSFKGHQWERSRKERFVLSGEQREANLKESKVDMKTRDRDAQRYHRWQVFNRQLLIWLGHSCKWQRLRSQETRRDIEELESERQDSYDFGRTSCFEKTFKVTSPTTTHNRRWTRITITLRQSNKYRKT